jgi:GGDEF domain-containing protein
MTESQLIHALATAARRLSSPGASPETVDEALEELSATAGVDCLLTDGRLDLRWRGGEEAEELRAAFEEALAALVVLAREAQARPADDVLDAHAFQHELLRCASAARWRDKRLAIAVFEVEGMSLGPGIDGRATIDIVGAAARSAVRQGDIVAHLGASRFAMLFPRAGVFEARAAYKRVTHAVASRVSEGLSCTAAGFAELDEQDADGNLLGQAVARLNAARLRRSYTGPHPSPTQPLAG